MRRVLMLTSHPLSPPWDSADKHIAHSVVAGLAERYRFVTFTRLGHPALGDAKAVRLPIVSGDGRPGLLERAQIAALTLAAEPAVDLVHAVMTIGPGFATLSQAHARLPAWMRRPMIHTVPALVHPSCLDGSRPLGTTVALSGATAAMLRAAGYPDVRVVPHGIPLARWPFLPPPSEPPSILFAGHLDEGGGAVESIRAVASAAAQMPRAPLLVMALRSRVEQDAGQEIARLRTLARTAGVDVEIHGVVPAMERLVARASVLVLPALDLHGKADVPLVILEALASGRPVVVSDLPSLAALEDGVTRVTPGDTDALGAAVRRLVTDADEWARRARHGRALVERKFAIETAVAAYGEIYGEAMRAA